MRDLSHMHPNGKVYALRSLRTFKMYYWQVTHALAMPIGDGLKVIFYSHDGSCFQAIFDSKDELTRFMNRPTLRDVPVSYST